MELQDDLSDDAKRVAVAFFPTEGSKVTFHMRESRPGPRAQAALEELVNKGVVSVEPFNQFGGFTYRPLVDFGPLQDWAFKVSLSGKDPITLWERIPL